MPKKRWEDRLIPHPAHRDYWHAENVPRGARHHHTQRIDMRDRRTAPAPDQAEPEPEQPQPPQVAENAPAGDSWPAPPQVSEHAPAQPQVPEHAPEGHRQPAPPQVPEPEPEDRRVFHVSVHSDI